MQRGRRPEGARGRRRRGEGGFSVIELLIVMAIVAIVAAIAVPNLREALKDARRTGSYKSATQIEHALLEYMITQDHPPETLNPLTLQELVDEGALLPQEAKSILGNFEGNRLMFYWANIWGYGWGWEYDYGVYFKVEGEPDSWCVMYPEATWCNFPGEGWIVVHGGN